MAEIHPTPTLAFLSLTENRLLILKFLFNLAACACLAQLLYHVYRRCGFALSNRSEFGRNFVLLATTTALIITVVKPSLELSMGLIGALSIIRFRTAIKDPEELCFLLLCIGIGLGFGADEGQLTTLAFAFIALVLWFRRRRLLEVASADFHLLVTSGAPAEIGYDPIFKTVQGHAEAVALKRLDETDAVLEAAFQVHFQGMEQLERCREKLRALGPSVRVSLIDNRGLGT